MSVLSHLDAAKVSNIFETAKFPRYEIGYGSFFVLYLVVRKKHRIFVAVFKE
jgi:hypothetical protein